MVVHQRHGEIRPLGEFKPVGKPTEKRARIVGLKSASAKKRLTSPVQQSTSGLAFMFPTLQNAQSRLPTGPDTVQGLIDLAAAMADPGEDKVSQTSDIPAVFTYFGQFLDHDISKIDALPGFLDPNLRNAAGKGPMTDPINQLENQRLAPLDLDSVYTKAPEDQGNSGKLRLGKVSPNTLGPGFRVPGKDDENDLPRNPPSTDLKFDRAAQIGDERNDENLIVAQLHVAFLRAHNELVEKHGDRIAARRELTKLYHEIIFTDFLPRIADLGVLNRVLKNGRSVWKPKSLADVPLEHSGAAYRFGHSMVRSHYYYNLNFGRGGKLIPDATPFNLLFVFTALSGQLGNSQTGETDTLQDNWIIDWSRMAVTEMARPIDTVITPAMGDLRDTENKALVNGMQFLAERNLLRGYLFGLPTGQAVAALVPGAVALSGSSLLAALPPQQRAAATPFQNATPLWFYILAEAGAAGGKLGVVGSTIVIETLHALAEATGAPLPKGPVKALTANGAPSGKLIDLLKLSGNFP
ncbi:MAG: peroxidase family protein [Devosia sp.]